MFRLKSCLYILQAWIFLVSFKFSYGLTKYDRKDLENLREEVRQMFQHAYDSYLNYAYPYDELRPLSCDGVDTWGSYSLTLIDALDTLAVMGNYTEFQRVVNIVTANANFDANINVSVFETNIRIIGGLLSAHLLSHRAGVSLVPGWPCNGPLLELAEDVARRLIAAFDTPTGMPYGTVNLQHGVPLGETTITCTAGVGTFILELGTLSRLTGDPIFEEVALTALDALHAHRSSLGLVGNHVDVATGRWTAQDAGIGAGVDSYYEYLAKGAILLQRPELMHMFNEGKAAIEKYLKRDDWHLWVSMSKGQVTLPVFQSLEAYWPGVLSLTGDIGKGMKSLHNYHQVWKQYGFTPEFYYIPQGEVGTNRESYPLRPELIESVMYLYRATGDPYLIEVGKDILRSIQHSAKTPCGYATIKDVRDHRKEDRMESFFLAETTKYLYLLFDPDNFLHNHGQEGTVVQTPWGECIVGTGGYIFNTEAHPIDPGALHCCSGPRQDQVQDFLRGTANSNNFKGTPLSTHQKRSKHSPLSKDSWDIKSDLPSDTVPLSKSATGHLDLISKAQIAKFANSMLPVQDLLLDTKEVIESTESESVDITRGTKPDSYPQNLAAELDGAMDVIQMPKAIDNDVSQLIEKSNKLLESNEHERSEGFDAAEKPRVKSVESQDGPLDAQDESWREELMRGTEGIRFESLPIELQQMLSLVGRAHRKAYPSGPTEKNDELEQLGKNAFKQYNLDTLFNDKSFQKRLSVIDMDDLLKVVHNAISVTKDNIKKIGKLETASDIEVDTTEDEKESIFKPEPVLEKPDDSKSDTLGYRADDSDDTFSGETIDLGSEGESSLGHTKSEDSHGCSESSQTATDNGGVCDREGESEEFDEFGEQESFVPTSNFVKTKFDPQALFERLQTENRYKRNATWVSDHNVLSCAAQPFLQRLSMSGEMFEVP